MLEHWKHIEALGYDSVWVADHFLNPHAIEEGWFDGWSVLAALATQTSTIRIGTLVTNIIYRNPALIARQAQTLDHISNGRFNLGIGATTEREPSQHMLGIENWSTPERVARFREVIEIGVDGAQIAARSVEIDAMALTAADIDQGGLPGRRARRRLEPPFAGLGDLRQRSEIGGQIGGVLIAHLAFDESRHDAPGLAHGLLDLRGIQATAGEIRPESALALQAVAIAARGRPGGVPLPIGLAGRRIARRLRGGHALGQRKQEHRDEEFIHGLFPP
jgi:hypothetical protein